MRLAMALRSSALTLSLLAVLISLCLAAPHAVCAAQTVKLSNSTWTVEVCPATLAVTARPKGKASVELSAAQDGLGPVEEVTQSNEEAGWRLPSRGHFVTMRLAEDTLSVRFRATSRGEVT